MKKQIGVIFGSRSCEREVAIISAVQLMRHADPEKYDIIPVYIDEAGSWYTGEVLKNIESYKPFKPDQKGITKGYSDGTFGIDRNVSRGECMMFLWRLKGKPAPKAVAKSPFTDVPKNHVFYNAIQMDV